MGLDVVIFVPVSANTKYNLAQEPDKRTFVLFHRNIFQMYLLICRILDIAKCCYMASTPSSSVRVIEWLKNGGKLHALTENDE